MKENIENSLFHRIEHENSLQHIRQDDKTRGHIHTCVCTVFGERKKFSHKLCVKVKCIQSYTRFVENMRYSPKIIGIHEIQINGNDGFSGNIKTSAKKKK